jgi:hypothetical protein
VAEHLHDPHVRIVESDEDILGDFRERYYYVRVSMLR